MKKIFGLILLLLVTVLAGCKSNSNIDEVKRVTNYLSGLGSYSLSSKMTINRPEKSVSVNVYVDYLSPSYYKVCFKGDNEQLIIKNDTGVYVITPSLNKEFRFDSEWPLNSSHAYLLETINKDIKADSEALGSVDNSMITIECKITHKANQKLNKMKYICDLNYKPLKTIFLNENNEECIIVDFDTFTPNNNIGKDNFNQKKYLGNQEEKPSEETSLTLTAGYIVEGSLLASTSKNDDTTILCYSGTSKYTIIVSKVEISDEVVAIEKYNNIEILNCGLGFFNDNTMRFYSSGYEITILSNELSVDDYINIANSISLS